MTQSQQEEKSATYAGLRFLFLRFGQTNDFLADWLTGASDATIRLFLE